MKHRLALYAAELRRAGARPNAITYVPRVVEWKSLCRSIAVKGASSQWPLLTGLGFDWRHINTVNGGFREEAATELWIVPPGAQPPCPTPGVRPEKTAYSPFVRGEGAAHTPNPTGTTELQSLRRFQ